MEWVHILRCADGSLYIGRTVDVSSRVKRHREGTACRYTAHRRPVTLVHQEQFASRQEAQTRERQLKRWTRTKKEALIAGDLALPKVL